MKKLLLSIFTLVFPLIVISQPCLPDGIAFTTQTQIDSFQINYPGCTIIEGSVEIIGSNINNINGLSVITSIGGNLIIWGSLAISNLMGLKNLISIGGNLKIEDNAELRSLSGLDNLSYIGGNLSFVRNYLQSNFTGLENLTSIEGDLLIADLDRLVNLTGLNNITSIKGNLKIYLTRSLTNLSDLANVTFIGGSLWLEENSLITSLTGLNNITSLGGGLWIEDMDRLLNLTGLNNITSISGKVWIEGNNALTNLIGLDNINAGSINELHIFDNIVLSKCEVESICNYLVKPSGIIAIFNNAPGCNSQEEVEALCESSCLPNGIVFNSQTQIDNFQANHPDCTEITGDVKISSSNGVSITDLIGLSKLTSIRGNLEIEGNEALSSLTGLNNMSYIGGSLSILMNSSLNHLTGLDNLTSVGENLSIIENENLIDLTGLNNLTYIGGDLLLEDNITLKSLLGLKSVNSIRGGLQVINNDALTNLTGLDNIDVTDIDSISIYNNNILTYCEIQNMCNYLGFSEGTVDIYNNAFGCNNPEEIANACGLSVSDNIGMLRQESEIKELKIRQSKIILFGLSALLLIIILGAILFIRSRKIQAQHALELERVKSEKLQELDQLKSQFFANISHEFRTPLTLIMGPLERVLSRSKDKNDNKDLSIAKKYARNLQYLINNLLSISKLESGKMMLHAYELDIVQLIRTYIQSFESLAKQKNIELKFTSEKKEIKAFIDRGKFEQILNNLLSNAFKFTSENGKIEVSVANTATESVRIIISDTGHGIATEHISHIFDRFYQVEQDDSYYEGTGIGLALTKELVNLHHGDISVESKPEIGTTFIVVLPLGKEHLNQEEIVDTDEPAKMVKLVESFEHVEQFTETCIHETPSDDAAEKEDSKPLILVVEDNDDLRSYILSYLTPDYWITQAVDGKMGLDKAIEQVPDLVISDVMMPKMDGFQLSQNLKTDERTSHIPIILLTARASIESRIEGLETGADDFITKPFDPLELLTRIKNLIQQRKTLQERFMKNVQKIGIDQLMTFDTPDLTSMDQSFIQKVTEYIIQDISNFDFNVEMLGAKMALSRRQLQRKLIGITGQPPSMFIRSVRLNRAAELLRNKTGNVTEIAYDVGFSNLSWFAKSFKEQFGVLPSEYPPEISI